jgi:hypothetical protein
MPPDNGQGPAMTETGPKEPQDAQEAPQRVVVGGRTLPREQRDRAYIASVQRDLNQHLHRLGWGRTVAIDGAWDKATQLAFERVCRVLGIDATPGPRAFRIIAGTAAERTPEEFEKARADGAAYAERLRALFRQQLAERGQEERREAEALPFRLVGGRPLAPASREQAYVATLQRDLNAHLRRLGADVQLAVDGQWDQHTEQAFQRVCAVLGLQPEKSRRVYRIIGGALVGRTEKEIEQATQQGALLEQRLRAEFLERRIERLHRGPEPVKGAGGGHKGGGGQTQTGGTHTGGTHTGGTHTGGTHTGGTHTGGTHTGGTHTGGTHTGGTHTHAGAGDLADLIDRNGGNGYGKLVVAKADKVGLPLVLACALVDLESSFSNVFGHDTVGTRNPIAKGSKVTKDSYKRYLAFRQQGLGTQGVGLTQLTFFSIQDSADRKGGCWKPAAQLDVGFQLLADHIKLLGRERGIRKYNGDHTSDKTLPYLEKFEKFFAEWSRILGGAGARADGRVGKGPRTLRRGHEGRDVALLQKTLNGYYREWGAPDLLDRDSDLGKATVLAYLRVAAVLGLTVRRGPKGRVLIPVRQRRVMRNPKLRTPQELERARTEGAEKERRLRDRFARERKKRGRRPKVINLGRSLDFAQMAPQTAAIHTVVGHHSACPTVDSSDKEALARCKSFHAQHRHKSPPWSGIGYHVCFARSGTIILLRPGNRIGAGVLGHNTGTFHVMFIGNYEHHQPSDAQLRSYHWFLEHGHTLPNVPALPTRRRVHRDFEGHHSNACSGKNLIPHLKGG